MCKAELQMKRQRPIQPLVMVCIFLATTGMIGFFVAGSVMQGGSWWIVLLMLAIGGLFCTASVACQRSGRDAARVCPDCGYDLRGTAHLHRRCPECGGTKQQVAWSRSWVRMLLTCMLAFLAIVWWVGALLFINVWQSGGLRDGV